jgi:hypothetical protein
MCQRCHWKQAEARLERRRTNATEERWRLGHSVRRFESQGGIDTR